MYKMTCDGRLRKSCYDPNTASSGEFSLGQTDMSFNNAKAYCEGKGATLAIITSQEQQNNAHGVCGGKKCWIGLTLKTVDGNG